MDSKERNEIIKKLREEHPIEEQVNWNEFNINEKLQENTKLKLEYQDLYEKEKFIYDNLLDKFDVLKGQRYDIIKHESDRNLTKAEVEQYYLPKDKKIRQMKEILKKQEIRVNFFELCTRSIDSLYWRIKAYLDNEKL